MNAPDAFLTLNLGEAEVRVPREAAVMAYLEQQLDRARPLTVGLSTAARLGQLAAERPNIGDKGLYGIYAGNARGYNGEPDGVLEVLDEAPNAMTWPEAMKWAESTGGRLPTRREQALLFANVPSSSRKRRTGPASRPPTTSAGPGPRASARLPDLPQQGHQAQSSRGPQTVHLTLNG
jgi:hypothetical protein